MCFSYHLRQLAFVLVDICYIQSVYDHIKSWLPLHKRREPLQLLNRQTEINEE